MPARRSQAPGAGAAEPRGGVRRGGVRRGGVRRGGATLRCATRHNQFMPQRDVGLILMRQLASGMAVPMLIADEAGDLLFFNEPAEILLGQRFDEVGELPLDQRRQMFAFRDEQGQPLPDDQPPLVVALREQRPVHRRVRLRGFDGRDREIEVTAFPLLGGGGHLIGGVAMFWERKPA